MKKAWEIFVDVVTLIWLGVFAADLAGLGGSWLGWVSAAIGGVFVADLVMIFRGSAGVRDFFRRAWLDLLLLIPFFRVFRIGRMGRLFRATRLPRLVRKKKFLRRIFRIEVLQEGADLFQKAVERLSRLSSVR